MTGYQEQQTGFRKGRGALEEFEDQIVQVGQAVSDGYQKQQIN